MKKFICLIFSCCCVAACSEKNRSTDIREDIVSLSLPEQRQLLQSLSPEKKSELWKLKLEDNLRSEFLSTEEKKHIRLIFGDISADAYKPGTPQYDSFKELCLYVEDVLRNDFGWDDVKSTRYMGTIMTEKEIDIFNKRLPEGATRL